MAKDRKLPPQDIDESLIGSLVLFNTHLNMPDCNNCSNPNECYNDPKADTVGFCDGKDFYEKEVIRVTDIDADYIYGDLIATTDVLAVTLDIPVWNVCRENITSYEILTVRELPLLIGYEYTTDLLQELLCQ